MNQDAMRWLFWKEYRLNRLIVYVTLFLMVFPHLFALYAIWWRYRHYGIPAGTWLDYLAVSSLYGLCLSQAALALIGGNAMAGERADRSAEFQAYLPLTRGKILGAKLLMALAIAGMIWLTNASILCMLGRDNGYEFWRNTEELIVVLANTATTGLTFFGVAWLFSSFLTSPTFSVCAGLITPLLVVSGVAYIDYLFEIRDLNIGLWYRAICLTAAPVCFALGTWLYLRRVEP